jgi:hypothetical protein
MGCRRRPCAGCRRGHQHHERSPHPSAGRSGATLLALAVAASVFVFAMMWKPWIILAGTIAGLWLAVRWGRRRYPLFDIFAREFARGFLRGR